MKKFFKKTEGFTLVELIVVIAILGILAGVGTVGYSGYIKKANMAADQQLVSQVANALQLQYYNSGADDGGFVTLSREGVTVPDDKRADAFGVAAMDAAFGSEWMSSATLKHEWNTGLADASVSTIGATKLLGTASSLTGVAAAVVGGNSPSNATNIIFGLTGNAALKAELQQYETNPNYDTIAANLLVKHISGEIGNMTVDAEGNTSEVSFPSSLAVTYAMVYSMANSESPYASAAQEKVDAFDAAMATLAEKEQADATGTHVMNDLMATVNDLMSDNSLTDGEGNPITFGEVYNAYAAENGMTDVNGIIDAMGFVNDVSQRYSSAESLSDKNLYASDAMGDLLTAYQNANNYGVVVQIDKKTGKVTVYPTEAYPVT